MELDRRRNNANLTKIIIAIGIIVVVCLVAGVGWLIVNITKNQPQEVVYSDAPTKDNGNGLALGSQTGVDNNIGLQGLTDSTNQDQKSLNPPGSASPNPKPVRTQTLPNGLQINEYVYGTEGRATKPNDTIAVHYVGYLTDGKIFDTSLKGEKTPFAFKLGAGQVIQGWDIGLQDMHVGAIRRLTIPSNLAYGAKGYPPLIAPNTPLVFDVQLVSVK